MRESLDHSVFADKLSEVQHKWLRFDVLGTFSKKRVNFADPHTFVAELLQEHLVLCLELVVQNLAFFAKFVSARVHQRCIFEMLCDFSVTKHIARWAARWYRFLWPRNNVIGNGKLRKQHCCKQHFAHVAKRRKSTFPENKQASLIG